MHDTVLNYVPYGKNMDSIAKKVNSIKHKDLVSVSPSFQMALLVEYLKDVGFALGLVIIL